MGNGLRCGIAAGDLEGEKYFRIKEGFDGRGTRGRNRLLLPFGDRICAGFRPDQGGINIDERRQTQRLSKEWKVTAVTRL